MTEPFPFGAQDDSPVAIDDEPAKDRRPLIALGVLGAVAVGAGAFLFLGGSSADEDIVVPPRKARPAAAAAAPAAKPVTVPAASTVQLGRNPFKALYVQPVDPPAQDPVEDPGAEAPQGTPIVVVGGGTGGTSSPDKPKVDKPVLNEVVLTRVYGEGKDRTAVFTVNGKQQTAKVGSTFGTSAQMLLLSLQQGPKDDQWTAVVQVGDGDPFDVVTGEPVFVP